MGRKLTDEEIVKALECCANGGSQKDCELCPIGIIKCFEQENLMPQLALDLINRQKADIERLAIAEKQYLSEIERLNKSCGLFDIKLKEQIKETYDYVHKADKLKKRNGELQKQVEVLTAEKENLYFLNKNLEDYIDNHEPIWKRNTEQAVKDTAKEICEFILKYWQGHDLVECDWLRVAIAEKYSVEME